MCWGWGGGLDVAGFNASTANFFDDTKNEREWEKKSLKKKKKGRWFNLRTQTAHRLAEFLGRPRYRLDSTNYVKHALTGLHVRASHSLSEWQATRRSCGDIARGESPCSRSPPRGARPPGQPCPPCLGWLGWFLLECQSACFLVP